MICVVPAVGPTLRYFRYQCHGGHDAGLELKHLSFAKAKMDELRKLENVVHFIEELQICDLLMCGSGLFWTFFSNASDTWALLRQTLWLQFRACLKMAGSQIVTGPEHAVLARAIGASHARVRWVHVLSLETINPISKKWSNTRWSRIDGRHSNTRWICWSSPVIFNQNTNLQQKTRRVGDSTSSAGLRWKFIRTIPSWIQALLGCDTQIRCSHSQIAATLLQPEADVPCADHWFYGEAARCSGKTVESSAVLRMMHGRHDRNPFVNTWSLHQFYFTLCHLKHQMSPTSEVYDWWC